MTKQAEAGKGSAPRKEQDQKAYSDGWDRIFGKKEDTYDREKDTCPDCGSPWYKHDIAFCKKPS